MHAETKYNNCHAFRNHIQRLSWVQKPNTTIVIMHSETKYKQLGMHSETKYNNCYAFRNQIQQLLCI